MTCFNASPLYRRHGLIGQTWLPDIDSWYFENDAYTCTVNPAFANLKAGRPRGSTVEYRVRPVDNPEASPGMFLAEVGDRTGNWWPLGVGSRQDARDYCHEHSTRDLTD